jgi:hypothetical protein
MQQDGKQGDKIKVKAKTGWGEIVEVDGWPLDSGLCVVQQITSQRFTVLHYRTGLGIVHDLPTLQKALEVGAWLAEQKEDWDNADESEAVLDAMMVKFPKMTRLSTALKHPDRSPINDPNEGRIIDG